MTPGEQIAGTVFFVIYLVVLPFAAWPLFRLAGNLLGMTSSDGLQNVLTYYCSGMLQMEPLVTSDALRDFANTLSHANRVVALGLNHSSVSAEQLAFRLNKFGVDCHMLWDDARMASYERVLKQGDVVVIFSISGRDFYETLVSEYRKNRVKVVLITMDPDSSLCHLVDISIVLPFLTYNAGGMYPMDETVIFFMFIEMLAEKLHQTLHRLDE